MSVADSGIERRNPIQSATGCVIGDVSDTPNPGALVFRGSCVIVDCDHSRTGRVSGLNRESWAEIGFVPCEVSRLPARWLVLISGTAGFCRFRLDAGGDRLPQGSPSWTGSEIGPRDWIWSDFGAIAGSAAGWSQSRNRRIPPF